MDNNKQYTLVTGASSGIGRFIAIKLSASGNVILCGRDEERLKKTKAECSEDYNQLIFRYDLGDIDNLEKELGDFVLANNAEVVHFVHCAGYMKMLPVRMTTIETLRFTFSVNVFAAFLIVKLLMHKKINNGALKSVVFISSNISKHGAKAFSAYGSSKGALDAIMRSLAVELAPAVRVNSVLPGAIKTEMTEDIFNDPEKVQRMTFTYPLGLGKVEDISHAVEFLLSEKASWITGQQITVDGGRTINITG
jgi:NAD(P)-dependent dehydrogenase (short-subunit alcohol dehydrogenase family)